MGPDFSLTIHIYIYIRGITQGITTARITCTWASCVHYVQCNVESLGKLHFDITCKGWGVRVGAGGGGRADLGRHPR
jgi:hypothetical protein